MEVIEEDAKEFVAGDTMGILEERNGKIDDPPTIDREMIAGNENEIIPSCCKSEKRLCKLTTNT